MAVFICKKIQKNKLLNSADDLQDIMSVIKNLNQYFNNFIYKTN